MTLIVIALALILERLIGGAYFIHKFDWFFAWAEQVEKRLPPLPWLAYGVVVAPLVLLVWGLTCWIQGYCWGLLNFALEIIVLSACLGPRLLDRDVDEYIAARERDDADAISQNIAYLTGKPAPEKLSAEVREVTEGIFYQANMRWYAVIFWFLLLGPVGALLYRLTMLLREDRFAAGELARRVYGVLGWLPARISALYFGLMGSMDEALYVFKSVHKNHASWAEGNQMVLSHTGCAAINMEVSHEQSDDRTLAWADAVDWVQRAKGLCLRVLMLWLATVAIFTLFGWMV